MCELLYTSKARLVVNPPCHSVAFDMFACVIYLCALLMCVVHITVSVVWMWYNVHIYVARARWLTPCVTPCHGCVSQSPSGRGRNSQPQCWLHHRTFLQCILHHSAFSQCILDQSAFSKGILHPRVFLQCILDHRTFLQCWLHQRPFQKADYTIVLSQNAYFTIQPSCNAMHNKPSHNAHYTIHYPTFSSSMHSWYLPSSTLDITPSIIFIIVVNIMHDHHSSRSPRHNHKEGQSKAERLSF